MVSAHWKSILRAAELDRQEAVSLVSDHAGSPGEECKEKLISFGLE